MTASETDFSLPKQEHCQFHPLEVLTATGWCVEQWEHKAANCKRQIKSPLTVLSTSTKRAIPASRRLCKTLLDWKQKQHMATVTFGLRKSQGRSSCICKGQRKCRMMLWEHQWCQDLFSHLSLLQQGWQRAVQFFGSHWADTRPPG